MGRITNKDYRDILNLVYLTNRCENVQSFVNTLFPPMIQLFHSECATFHLVKGTPQHLKVVESRSFKSDSHNLNEDKYYPALYKNNFFQHSPLLKEAISSSKVVLKIGDSISNREWERSILYNQFILPQHLYRELFIALRWEDSLEGMITLWRSKEQPEYNDCDFSKAEILAPQLVVTMRNANLISKINDWKKRLTCNDENNREGLLLLDHKFKPLYSNVKARQICLQLVKSMQTETSTQGDDEFPIPPPVIKDCSILLDILKVEEQAALSPRERIIFTQNNQKFRIECSLIWKNDRINCVPNFMVSLNDLSEDKSLAANLQVRFHLSKRELEIVSYIIGGLSYEKIADKLCISKLTVHTHIKNVYRKLGAKSRIELYKYMQSPIWQI
jgi:DNA-binding CsgD family transcriptional regulator